MKSKKGIIGRFVVTFVATIVIALILLVFVYLSSMTKFSSKDNTGTAIYKEDMLGIDDGVGYINNYAKLVEAKGKVDGDTSLYQAISEVGYEK